MSRLSFAMYLFMIAASVSGRFTPWWQVTQPTWGTSLSSILLIWSLMFATIFSILRAVSFCGFLSAA